LTAKEIAKKNYSKSNNLSYIAISYTTAAAAAIAAVLSSFLSTILFLWSYSRLGRWQISGLLKWDLLPTAFGWLVGV